METCASILMAQIHSTCVVKDYGSEWHKTKLCHKEKRNLNKFFWLPVSDKYCNITNLNVLVDRNLCINLDGKSTQHMFSQGLRFGMAQNELCFKEKINLNKKKILVANIEI